MKQLEEILKNKKLLKIWRNNSNDKCLQLKLTVYSDKQNSEVLVKFTKAVGWEHLSVSTETETPCWDCMEEMKEIFWEDDEECFQLHPKKSNYINNHEHCLHIWRPLEQQIPIPDTILVGFRPGHEEEDKEKFIKFQEAIGYPISEQEANMYVQMAKKGSKQIQQEIQNIMKQLGVI